MTKDEPWFHYITPTAQELLNDKKFAAKRIAELILHICWLRVQMELNPAEAIRIIEKASSTSGLLKFWCEQYGKLMKEETDTHASDAINYWLNSKQRKPYNPSIFKDL